MENLKNSHLWVSGFLVALLIGLAIVGPSRLYRAYRDWKTDAYGANWLVIQQDMNRNPVHIWKLKNRSIGNEEMSDSIFFTDNNGYVIHLSAPYIYLEVTDGNFFKALSIYKK